MSGTRPEVPFPTTGQRLSLARRSLTGRGAGRPVLKKSFTTLSLVASREEAETQEDSSGRWEQGREFNSFREGLSMLATIPETVEEEECDSRTDGANQVTEEPKAKEKPQQRLQLPLARRGPLTFHPAKDSKQISLANRGPLHSHPIQELHCDGLVKHEERQNRFSRRNTITNVGRTEVRHRSSSPFLLHEAPDEEASEQRLDLLADATTGLDQTADESTLARLEESTFEPRDVACPDPTGPISGIGSLAGSVDAKVGGRISPEHHWSAVVEAGHEARRRRSSKVVEGVEGDVSDSMNTSEASRDVCEEDEENQRLNSMSLEDYDDEPRVACAESALPVLGLLDGEVVCRVLVRD